MSPVTYTFVILLLLMMEWGSPLVNRMMRPSSMYMLAAIRVGASKIQVDWITYAISR